MGLLLQNINKFGKEYVAANGILDLEQIKKWFGNQKAIKRNCSLNEVEFEPKSAVMIVGVSGIGKSSFAEAFLSDHPSFQFCSYDECYEQVFAEASEKTRVNKEQLEVGTQMLFEKIIRNANRHGKNILLDGLFLNCAFRGAVLSTLQTFGYKIHLVYFTKKYAMEKKDESCIRRAIELYLFKEFTNMKVSTIEEALRFRKEIIKLHCKHYNTTPEEVYEKYASNANIKEVAKKLLVLMQNEMDNNGVETQEINEVFTFGAHYYYEM